MSTREHSSRSNWLSQNWLALTTAVVVSVAVLVLMRETPWPFDPMFYMDNSMFFTGERASLALEHRSLRWGLMLPMGVLQMLFGYSEATYYSIPIVAIGLLASAVYLLSRRLLGPWWAAAAAVLTAANPLILSRSSHPFPDTLATALVVLGIAALAWIRDEDEKRNYWLAGAAGILFGLAYAVREVVAPVFAPIILILLLLLRLKARYWLLIAAGGLGVFVVEFGLMNAWFEDPLARLRILLYRDQRTVEESSSNLDKIERINAFQGTLGLSLTAMFRKWGEVGLGIAPVVGLLGLAVSWFRRGDDRERRLWLGLAAWLVVGWLAFVAFGLWRSEDGVPVLNLTQIRYWYLLIPPVTIGVVGLLHALTTVRIRTHDTSRRLSTLFAGVACGLLCLAMVADSWGERLQVVPGTDHMGEFREWLTIDQHGREVIAAEHRTMRIADMYDNSILGKPLWDGKVSRLHTASEPAALMVSTEDLRSGLLLIDGREYHTSAPPVEWDLQFVSSDGMLAILAAEDLEEVSREPRSVAGPDLPSLLEVGRYRTWRPEQPTGGPYRYRVSFSGQTPVARCGWLEEAGERASAPALYVGNGVQADDMRHLDIYCPTRSGDSWLALTAQPDSNTWVNEIVVVNDEIVDAHYGSS